MDERISFLCNATDNMYKTLSDKEKVKKQEFVKNVYEQTKEVYSNFYKILQYAYKEIDNGRMTVNEAVDYLNDERLPFKLARHELRGYIKQSYYRKNKELLWFSVGVRGILCGGVHGITNYILNPKFKRKDELPIVPFRGAHTLTDIISAYDENNMKSWYYNEQFDNLSKNEKNREIRDKLLDDIKRQIRQIEESWEIVCETYPKIMF